MLFVFFAIQISKLHIGVGNLSKKSTPNNDVLHDIYLGGIQLYYDRIKMYWIKNLAK